MRGFLTPGGRTLMGVNPNTAAPTLNMWVHTGKRKGVAVCFRALWFN